VGFCNFSIAMSKLYYEGVRSVNENLRRF